MLSVGLLAVAAVLVLLGRWGRRNASSLVPGSLSAPDRRHREAVLRRGGLACHGAALLLAVAAVGRLL